MPANGPDCSIAGPSGGGFVYADAEDQKGSNAGTETEESEDEESGEDTEIEEDEEDSGEDTETEEPRSSVSEVKQPQSQSQYPSVGPSSQRPQPSATPRFARLRALQPKPQSQS